MDLMSNIFEKGAGHHMLTTKNAEFLKNLEDLIVKYESQGGVTVGLSVRVCNHQDSDVVDHYHYTGEMVYTGSSKSFEDPPADTKSSIPVFEIPVVPEPPTQEPQDTPNTVTEQLGTITRSDDYLRTVLSAIDIQGILSKHGPEGCCILASALEQVARDDADVWEKSIKSPHVASPCNQEYWVDKQVKAFTDLNSLGEYVKSLAGYVQNDFERMIQDGHITKHGIHKILGDFLQCYDTACKQFQEARELAVSILRYHGEAKS